MLPIHHQDFKVLTNGTVRIKAGDDDYFVQCSGGLGKAVGAGASKHLLPAKCVKAVGISGIVGEIFPPLPLPLTQTKGLVCLDRGLRAVLCPKPVGVLYRTLNPPPSTEAGDCRVT
uniref:Uncharacterized protein n=1 Tax=Glossina pallidipes TaxID=7398 RepID=A0A1A9ZQP8_GLOPL